MNIFLLSLCCFFLLSSAVSPSGAFHFYRGQEYCRISDLLDEYVDDRVGGCRVLTEAMRLLKRLVSHSEFSIARSETEGFFIRQGEQVEAVRSCYKYILNRCEGEEEEDLTLSIFGTYRLFQETTKEMFPEARFIDDLRDILHIYFTHRAFKPE